MRSLISQRISNFSPANLYIIYKDKSMQVLSACNHAPA